MQIVILAGGRGTRLRPLTYDIPKPMLPIVNKPVLEHTLELLRNYGIKEVMINLHHQSKMIKKYFGNGSDWGIKINYSEEKDYRKGQTPGNRGTQNHDPYREGSRVAEITP